MTSATPSILFVWWCGPVEPFPDVGGLGALRCCGGTVAGSGSDGGEPFEGGGSHAGCTQPAAQLERFLESRLGDADVAVGFMAPSEPDEGSAFGYRCTKP